MPRPNSSQVAQSSRPPGFAGSLRAPGRGRAPCSLSPHVPRGYLPFAERVRELSLYRSCSDQAPESAAGGHVIRPVPRLPADGVDHRCWLPHQRSASSLRRGPELTRARRAQSLRHRRLDRLGGRRRSRPDVTRPSWKTFWPRWRSGSIERSASSLQVSAPGSRPRSASSCSTTCSTSSPTSS